MLATITLSFLVESFIFNVGGTAVDDAAYLNRLGALRFYGVFWALNMRGVLPSPGFARENIVIFPY